MSDSGHTERQLRRALLASAGLAAAGAGGWLALRQDAIAAPAKKAAAKDLVPASFWAQQLDAPEGAALKFASLQGKPLLVNFWATWCPPCVKEMPEIDRFHQEFSAKGWQVVGIAVDSPTPVKGFLARKPVGFPIGLAGMEGTQLAFDLGNTGGALPYTVVIDAQGVVRQRKMGPTTFKEMAGWAKAIKA